MTRATEIARQAILESACEWLITLHDEDATATQRAAFSDWLVESPVHVREYLAAEATWALIGECLCHGDDCWEQPVTDRLDSTVVSFRDYHALSSRGLMASSRSKSRSGTLRPD